MPWSIESKPDNLVELIVTLKSVEVINLRCFHQELMKPNSLNIYILKDFYLSEIKSEFQTFSLSSEEMLTWYL